MYILCMYIYHECITQYGREAISLLEIHHISLDNSSLSTPIGIEEHPNAEI